MLKHLSNIWAGLRRAAIGFYARIVVALAFLGVRLPTPTPRVPEGVTDLQKYREKRQQELSDHPQCVTLEEGVPNIGGYVTVEVIRDGRHGPQVLKRIISHNLVVNAGKRQILRLASGLQTNIFDQMRVGTNGAAATSAQTNVQSPVVGTINTVDSRTMLAGTRTMQWIYSLPSGVGSISATNIQEAVILNQNTSPGGSCMMRVVYTPVTKTEDDKLKLTYSLRVT